MNIRSQKKPFFGCSNGFYDWIKINDPKYNYDELLSVSPNAKLEILDFNNRKYILIFPVCRFVLIKPDFDNRNRHFFSTTFNERDLKKSSELPEENPDEKLK